MGINERKDGNFKGKQDKTDGDFSEDYKTYKDVEGIDEFKEDTFEEEELIQKDPFGKWWTSSDKRRGCDKIFGMSTSYKCLNIRGDPHGRRRRRRRRGWGK